MGEKTLHNVFRFVPARRGLAVVFHIQSFLNVPVERIFPFSTSHASKTVAIFILTTSSISILHTVWS